jgi:hypothetical protein
LYILTLGKVAFLEMSQRIKNDRFVA